MVRIFVFLSLFCIFLNAVTLEEKIESFVGNKNYNIQKNLINIIFKNKSAFLKDDGLVDDIKVLSELKKNGLLKLFYSEPRDLYLSFFSKEDSIIFMRVINESLSLMGYNYFLTKKAIKNQDGFLWQIVVSTEHVVDPLILAKRLENRGCFFKNIEKLSENEWRYEIDTNNIRVDSLHVEEDTTVTLKKAIRPYWIDVYGMKSISIRTKIADRWHPSVVFFDEKLNVVKSYKKDSVVKNIKLKVPENAKYVKINDIYTLDNIKRGILVYVKSR